MARAQNMEEVAPAEGDFTYEIRPLSLEGGMRTTQMVEGHMWCHVVGNMDADVVAEELYPARVATVYRHGEVRYDG